MKRIYPTLRFLMLLTALLVGCVHVPESVRHDPTVESWINEVKAEEEADQIWWIVHTGRIAGYNEAVLYGRIQRIDATPIDRDVEMRSLSMDKIKWIRRHFTESSPLTLCFNSGTFTNQPPPQVGEHWIVYATANAKGIWYIHGAKRSEMQK